MKGETLFGEDEEKKVDMIHYQKINIFGEPGVGKSSLISSIENIENDNYVIEGQEEFNRSMISDSVQSSLVEDIKKTKIKFNEEVFYLNLYETNINRYDLIKINLETLLFQTECVIIMWDEANSFENVPSLIKTIKDYLDKKNDKNVSFILLQNKIDLKLNYSRESNKDNDIDIDKSIEEIKKENQNIIFKKISLLNKDDIFSTFLDINRSLDRTNIENKNNAIDLVKVDYPINQRRDNQEYGEIKISLLGDSATGKTSFLNNLNKKSIDNMTSTLGVLNTLFYAYIDNKKFKINIMDTAGQENYRSIPENMIKKMDGFLLFIDITNEASLNSIEYWMKIINENNTSKEILLLANKIDESEKRIVQKNKIKEIAEKYNIRNIECSCKNNINIYEILNEIIFMSYNRFQEKINSPEIQKSLAQPNENNKCIC